MPKHFDVLDDGATSGELRSFKEYYGNNAEVVLIEGDRENHAGGKVGVLLEFNGERHSKVIAVGWPTVLFLLSAMGAKLFGIW